MRKFLPQSVLDAFPTKKLRKLVIAHFKEFAPLSEDECVLRFYKELKHVSSFHQESFQCALGKVGALVQCLVNMHTEYTWY